jgi:hypothetical protein
VELKNLWILAKEVIQDLRETSYRCPVGGQNGRNALGVDCLEREQDGRKECQPNVHYERESTSYGSNQSPSAHNCDVR